MIHDQTLTADAAMEILRPRYDLILAGADEGLQHADRVTQLSSELGYVHAPQIHAGYTSSFVKGAIGRRLVAGGNAVPLQESHLDLLLLEEDVVLWIKKLGANGRFSNIQTLNQDEFQGQRRLPGLEDWPRVVLGFATDPTMTEIKDIRFAYPAAFGALDWSYSIMDDDAGLLFALNDAPAGVGPTAALRAELRARAEAM